MKKRFNIHGDNIVECERILDLILQSDIITKVEKKFSSLSCIEVHTETANSDILIFTLFPGFNKSNSDRWNKNILQLLRECGSFLDEAPDVILTEVTETKENILLAIEFCSALQAGNQAWQRSGRAYSTGRANIPFLYIVDFVKYELNSKRERLNLRFPNPAVPYSYINYSTNIDNVIIQAYFKAEEFQPSFDEKLKDFDENIFAESAVIELIIKKLLNKDTTVIEKELLNKNFEMVKFMSKDRTGTYNFSQKDWGKVHEGNDIVTYSTENTKFNFYKKMAAKSIVGRIEELNDIVKKHSIGIASRSLPFGLIPKHKRQSFANEVISLYDIKNKEVIKYLKQNDDLIVCMLKGFKPRGDDNRPDRGALPLVAKLMGETSDILTCIYGPIIKKNLKLIDNDIMELAYKHGLWKTIVGLSDLILIDSHIVKDKSLSVFRLIENQDNKKSILKYTDNIKPSNLTILKTPKRYQENDVDTILHVIFKYLLNNAYEGMCNPPGGDWSNLTIQNPERTKEYKWLSLPRVSGDGKRPDHVVELFDIGSRPILLSIESKEKASDLKKDIGPELKNYIKYFLDYVPSVEKQSISNNWEIGESILDIQNYDIVSVGAFLERNTDDFDNLNRTRKCDILIGLTPDEEEQTWTLTIKSYSNNGNLVKDNIIESLNHIDDQLNIFNIK